MTTQEYIDSIAKRYATGISREHSYRGDLQQLLETILPNIMVTNEPARFKFGAPDYILTHKDVPVGFIEAKDIDDGDLDGKKKSGNKEQFDRYKASLENIIFTDYLDFHFYRDKELITTIRIAEIQDGKIIALPENFKTFENLIIEFARFVGQTIRSSKKLAEMMAGKARLLYDVLHKALSSDELNNLNTTLHEQMRAFKEILIHDITAESFADIYAQTIAYGLFAARLHDDSLDNFSRQEAAELIPKTNPFLRRLFGYIAGPDIDERILWIVDDLARIFLATNVREILKDYGKSTKMEDPIIHFYETFLSEYDPKLRKARGVWYTPQPVVNFIVRAVDDILKTEFDLPMGLADTSKTSIKVNTDNPDKRSPTGYRQVEQEVHKVQILDPATGTGTFLSEVVKQIYKRFEGQQGIWSNYVEEHLLPRLNGFELLMASYAMAHLQLDLLLTDKGYKGTSDQRLRVYLTNSLEEYHKDTDTLFANWLSTEANEANRIKRDTPVMCVIGNPPYSGESANKGEWIMNLMEDYKKEPGGKEKLKERNPKWINDDYVKFIRYGQHFIEKNGSGVLAFINPHGFLDNPTFRGMRWNLLKTYDKIYTIDLHGNSLKKETTPDGSKDENVFDIMTGVSINLFIKTGRKKKNELGQIYHYDLYGQRGLKYNFLNENSIKTIPFNEIPNVEPMYFMVQKDFEAQKEYDKGFKISDLYPLNNVGVVTSRDSFVIDEDRIYLENRINDFFTLSKDELFSKYKIRENKSWKIDEVKKTESSFDGSSIKKVLYRPFDSRFIYYNDSFIERSRSEVMSHFIEKENIGLSLCKQFKSGDGYVHSFITNKIIESSYVSNRTSEITSIFPLYLYPEETTQSKIEEMRERVPNLKMEIVEQIAKGLGLKFVPEKDTSTSSVSGSSSSVSDSSSSMSESASEPVELAPIDLLDYIYAVLHSPSYREKYKEFLKIDFPRVPYPTDKEQFWQLVKLGGELRQIHLLESPQVENYITQYPEGGDNIITRKLTKTSIGYEATSDTHGRVWINDAQYFDNVPLVAWEFYIGGYQPAQKWLKDRRDRELNFEDILHYQKIIVALTETDRLMKEVDEVMG